MLIFFFKAWTSQRLLNRTNLKDACVLNLIRPLSDRAVAHALSEEFDATELWRAHASLETIDLRALAFGPN